MNKTIHYTYTIILSVLVFIFIPDLCMFTQDPQEYKYAEDPYAGYLIKSIGTIIIYLFLLVICIVTLRNSKNKIINLLYYIGLIFFACTIIYNLYDWYSSGFDH
jgi:ACR3 family arsenite efflux pump ArsB